MPEIPQTPDLSPDALRRLDGPRARRALIESADDAGKIRLMAFALLQIAGDRADNTVRYPDLVAWGFNVSEVERLGRPAKAEARRILDAGRLTLEAVA